MSFQPINDDHAVQSVAFFLHFDRPLDQRVIHQLHSSRERWLPDLPAVQLPQMFGFEIGPAGAAPKQITGHGIEFSYLRPDGTPAWQLRVDSGSAVVECTRYTRWDRVWQSARTHLLTALEVINTVDLQPALTISATALQYVDRFVSQSADADYKSILSEGSQLPASVFQFGDAWHSHTGWFDKSFEIGVVLNNLNVDARNDMGLDGSPLMLDLLHLQQLRYNDRRSLSDFLASAEEVLDAPMQELHSRNKSLVCSLIVEDMQERIGIVSSSATKQAEKS